MPRPIDPADPFDQFGFKAKLVAFLEEYMGPSAAKDETESAAVHKVVFDVTAAGTYALPAWKELRVTRPYKTFGGAGALEWQIRLEDDTTIGITDPATRAKRIPKRAVLEMIVTDANEPPFQVVLDVRER